MSLGRYSMFIDRAGNRFGRWTALRQGENYVRGNIKWVCRCDCGTEKEVQLFHLIGGKTQSCGCLQEELTSKRARTHGLSNTRTYMRWWDMLRRCEDPRHSTWEKYGARGISVCERWHTFENFFADMGHPPDGMTIHRIDNDGNYEPDNCKWATRAEQDTNKRSSRILEFNGERLIVTHWAKRLGMNPQTLQNRIGTYGWSVERALTEPINSGSRRPRTVCS